MLKGIKVLDLSRYFSGPLCATMLAQQGAQVIKIQNSSGDGCRKWGPPFHPDGTSVAFDAMNHTKKSVVLNLKIEKSQQALRDLAARCDILVENFKPGTLDRFNCGYDQLKLLNQRLIYCSISGYGTKGPLSSLGGFDTTIQAYSGLLCTTGTPEQPFKVGFSVTDILCSYISMGCISQALYHRQRTGKGVKIESSLLQAALYSIGVNAQASLDANYEFVRTGNSNYLLCPQGIYHSKDKQAFLIACGSEPLYRKLAGIIGMELKQEFDTNQKRRDSWDKFDSIFRKKIAQFEMDYLESQFFKASIPYSRINTITEALQQPQVHQMGLIAKEKGNPSGRSYVDFPAHISNVKPSRPEKSPELGADTAKVLKEVCGYSQGEIEEVMKNG